MNVVLIGASVLGAIWLIAYLAACAGANRFITLHEWLGICQHKELDFVRNLYGDEIVEYGWKRSIWQCKKCGGYVYQEHLHKESK